MYKGSILLYSFRQHSSRVLLHKERVMKILMIGPYPPIQGGASSDMYWTAQLLSEAGNSVHVISNAEDVNELQKVQVSFEDRAFLYSYGDTKRVQLHTTSGSEEGSVGPADTVVSKLATYALSAIRVIEPDVLWVYYTEPYGVAGFITSQLTEVPYLLHHTENDAHYLSISEDTATLYAEIFRKANAILTTEAHRKWFQGLGVTPDRLLRKVRVRPLDNVFWPAALPRIEGQFIVGSYGKVTSRKGVFELIEAVCYLRRSGIPILLKALWGGSGFPSFGGYVERQIMTLYATSFDPFIPPWQMSQFIRSCHAIVSLEPSSYSTRFPIAPREALACGRPVIMNERTKLSEEYQELTAGNDLVFSPRHMTPYHIAEALKNAYKWVNDNNTQIFRVDRAAFNHAHAEKEMSILLSAIEQRL